MTTIDAAALDAADAAVLVVDGDGRISRASAGARRLLRCSDEMLHALLDDLLRDPKPHDWSSSEPVVLQRLDGSAVTVRAAVVPLDPVTGSHLLVLHDVTVDEHRLADLSFRVEHDAASGLHNRAHLTERLMRWLGDKRSVALIAIELQRFDALVSPLGDQYSGTLLGAAARRMAEVSDSEDVIARIGPTHLVFLRPDVDDDEDALDLCVDIVDSIGTTLEFDGITFPTAAVCGATISRPGESAEAALHSAGLALRQALTDQVDMQLFSEPLRSSERRRATVERALELAVATRSLELYLQPVVAVDRSRLLGYEGLSRWRHPVLGPVSPLEFIPLAERAGLMRAIGEWSVESALRILARWSDANVPLVPIAVNLSATQLLDTGFARWMVDAVSTQHAQGLIVAEVKESLLQSGRAHELMTSLVDGGIVLAVDGFGTGSSALAYLADLPVSVVKIDRSIVGAVGRSNNARTRILVRSAIEMAHALGLSAIAEGVETAAEATALAEMGCNGIQGYFTGAPEPAPLVHRYAVADPT